MRCRGRDGPSKISGVCIVCTTFDETVETLRCLLVTAGRCIGRAGPSKRSTSDWGRAKVDIDLGAKLALGTVTAPSPVIPMVFERTGGHSSDGRYVHFPDPCSIIRAGTSKISENTRKSVEALANVAAPRILGV